MMILDEALMASRPSATPQTSEKQKPICIWAAGYVGIQRGRWMVPSESDNSAAGEDRALIARTDSR